MRILIVCGSGASSTFLALRLRSEARARGVALDPVAVPHDDLSVQLDDARLLVVSAALLPRLPDVALAPARGVPVLALPEELASPHAAASVLDHVLGALGGRPDPASA